MPTYIQEKVIPDDMAGHRLDQALAKIFPEFSRSRLKNWILDGSILVKGESWKPRDLVNGGESISIQAKHHDKLINEPERIDFKVEYEDKEIVVINKPANLVVHPGAGNSKGTLMNGLLYQWPELSELPRAGIVHRLDKDTSGLMVIAKNLKAHNSLVKQLSAREVSREYNAICNGVLTGGGTINKPIRRHPVHRIKMIVRDDGKEAITHYKVLQRFRAHTHIKVNLETGRTHQIRVHFASRRHALVGDPVYGRMIIPASCSKVLEDQIRSFRRQALCASKLELIHPSSGEKISVEVDLASDYNDLLGAMEEDLSYKDA
ncbi:MAG TPA: 23S rRNA pseudouridine(1911/1915/1917) synthase RluD [Woeseiaceae bacterium]|nr:23S rRNA pseudouridine(1911/1915/1917) synthase RluD [Woeseiaceae bacterium]|tara:strand:+ start:22227 stop:23183 length:957 start_codon:yes stop_codon:yes gene_type:complete